MVYGPCHGPWSMDMDMDMDMDIPNKTQYSIYYVQHIVLFGMDMVYGLWSMPWSMVYGHGHGHGQQNSKLNILCGF